jgi:hypothetical protein
MENIITCPWCNKKTKVLETAIENTRHYGSNYHKFSCNSCNKTIKMYFKRIVMWDSENIKKSTSDPDF